MSFLHTRKLRIPYPSPRLKRIASQFHTLAFQRPADNTTPMIPSHPIDLLPRFNDLALQTRLGSFEYEFSKYIYVPRAIAEKRKPYRADPESFRATYMDAKTSLESVEEIAFHSRLRFPEGRVMHLSMIDMGCASIDPYFPKLKEAFADFGIPSFSVFSSGRSFHIYGHGLLANDHELVRFMGRILLLNLPEQERVIDERWVGHRLMGGYSTLRWTNNNPHYKAAPTHYAEV